MSRAASPTVEPNCRSETPLQPSTSDRSMETSPLSPSADTELSAVATRMAREIKLRDRVYRLKEYKCCFKGSDAVQWLLLNEIATTVDDAVRFGNRLRERGFIRHVTNGHIFANRDHFYWFHESIMEKCSCPTASSYTSLLGWRGTVTADAGNELTQLQRTVYSLQAEMQETVYQSRHQIASLSHQLQQFEERLQRERDHQKWQLWWVGMSYGVVLLLLNLHFLINTALVLLLVYSCVSWRPVAHPQLPSSFQNGLQRVDSAETSSESLFSAEDGSGVVLSDFEDWPDAPCLLFAPPCLLHSSSRRILFNAETPFTFESELFKGQAALWVDGLPSSPPDLFKGKRRKSCFVVQGRFKEALLFEDVLSGQEFSQPLVDLPAEFLIKAMLKIAKTLNPSSRNQLTPYPQFLTSLISTAQVVHVAEEGQAPALGDAIEDMRAVEGPFREAGGAPVAALARKRLMQSASQRAGLQFDTHHIWTFWFWQHLLDLSTFQLDMTVKRLHLLHHLNRQPLLLMARHSDGRRLWNFELWHRELLTMHASP